MTSFLYSLLFICILFAKDGRTSPRRGDERLSGGREVDIKDYAYMAYLAVYDSNTTYYYQCGGSIISRRHILTAAHCFYNKLSVNVRIGSADFESGGYTYDSIITFMSHPQFNINTLDNDVAIVTIPQGMTINNNTTRIVNLIGSNKLIPGNTSMNVTGWGTTEDESSTDTTLRAITVPSYTNEECSALVPGYGITPRMFCAGYDEGGIDHCEGDSGGPAVHNNVQYGIVSFGKIDECAPPGYPGVYTNITNPSIRRFIRVNAGV